MNRLSALIALIGLTALAAPALADTTTVNPSQTSNNSSSASSTPYASNSQVNIQNAYNGVVGTGAGYTCPTTSLSVGVANTGYANPGFANSSATSMYGTLNVPFNSGGALDTCRERATVDLSIARANLDAGKISKCAEWKQAGLNLNAPALVAFGCGGLVSMAVVPNHVMAPAPATAAAAKPLSYHTSNISTPSCLADYHRDADLAQLHAHRQELKGAAQSPDITALRSRLAQACNVTSADLQQALNGP